MLNISFLCIGCDIAHFDFICFLDGLNKRDEKLDYQSNVPAVVDDRARAVILHGLISFAKTKIVLVEREIRL